MANAPLKTQPNAQPDVPRTQKGALPEAPHGPVDTALAQAINDLRNAVSAIGPLNFLPERYAACDIDTLRAATAVVLRLVDANNQPPR